MAIQLRRGTYADFDPDKMVSGEVAVVIAGDPNSKSGRSIYICFAPGIVKRFATYEDMQENISLATEEIQELLTEDVQNAILLATQATNTANTAAGTAEEAAEVANSAAEAANEAAALANAAASGDISDKIVTFTEEDGELESGQTLKNLFGRTKRKLSNLFSNIGTLADLATTDKSSIVAAINALKLITDGKVDTSKALDTYAEIMAATQSGFWPDAMAVKEGFNQVNSTSEAAATAASEAKTTATAAQQSAAAAANQVAYADFTFTGNSVPANGSSVVMAFSIAKTGYTAIGVTMYAASQYGNGMAYIPVMPDATHCAIFVKNYNGGSAYTASGKVRVAYKKN